MLLQSNRELIALKQISTPIICEDFVRYGKGKKQKLTKKIDYSQLTDGCHPNAAITK